MKTKEVEIEAVRFMKNKVDSRGGPLGVTNKRRLVLDGGWVQRVPFAVASVPSRLIPYNGGVVIPSPFALANSPNPAKAGEGAHGKLRSRITTQLKSSRSQPGRFGTLSRYKQLTCPEEIRLVDRGNECAVQFVWLLAHEKEPPLPTTRTCWRLSRRSLKRS